jgi:hypothetical protein
MRLKKYYLGVNISNFISFFNENGDLDVNSLKIAIKNKIKFLRTTDNEVFQINKIIGFSEIKYWEVEVEILYPTHNIYLISNLLFKFFCKKIIPIDKDAGSLFGKRD